MIKTVFHSYIHTKPRYEKRYLLSFPLAAVLASVFIFCLIMLAAVEDNRFVYFSERNIEQMKEFSAVKDRADVSVVMLGDSRLRHALRAGFDPNEILELPDGEKIALIQFAVNAAQYMDFHSLSSEILAAKPDYLFVGRQLLSNARAGDQQMLLHSRLVYSYLETLLKNPNEQELDALWREDRQGLEECFDELPWSAMKTRLEATRQRDYHSLNLEENRNLRPLRSFLDKMTQMGTQVVVLHIAPNTEVLEGYNVSLHELDAQGIGYMPTKVELLPDLYDKVVWFDYKHPYGPDHYCDFVHLNEKGRPVFKEWFLNTLEHLEK